MATHDSAQTAAFNRNATMPERTEALSELQKAHMPLASELFPSDEMRPVIEQIQAQWAEEQFAKSLRGSNIVPFPAKNKGKPGMQSIRLDELLLNVQGDYIERPGQIGFDGLRQMCDQTPVLSAIIMTRVRQVQRFCAPQESGRGPGFVIRHCDRDHQLTGSEKESIQLLTKFFQHGGWEFDPRRRKQLRRDAFPQFMAKLVRDSLSMDSCAIETEFKRDRSRGIDGLYAVDGSTIRLCTEEGYQGHDELFALQVVQGRIRSAYGFDDLIYEPRNPRSDVLAAGYGLSEAELLIRVVTGFLNAMTLNIKGFSDNAIPKGMMHLIGNYDASDLASFKRYWNSMVKGINNAWTVPVMVSKDPESKASFEKFDVEFDEMYFAKWMTFLTSIMCAIYSIAPDEINFESFSASSSSSLSGNDTSEKLAASKDKGLRPLLGYFEGLFTDFALSSFGDKYVFRFAGLDESDDKTRNDRAEKVLTVNELRAVEGYEKMDGPLGDAPLNTSLVQPWLQIMQAQEPQDFGAPQAGGPGDEQQDGGDGDSTKQGVQEAQEGAGGAGADGGAEADKPPQRGDGGGAGDGMASTDDDEEEGGEPMKKALDFGVAGGGTPVFVVEA